jgi:type IV fimbrial biogenesis protein FimT
MNSMRMHRGSTAGYTLVELMVVITVAAIILAYGIPSYNSVITQNRMASEINDLANAMDLARSSAIRQGVNVTICASATPTSTTPPPSCSGSSKWSTGWIVFTDIPSNQTYSTASGDALLQVHGALSSGDTLTGETGAVGAYGGNIASVTFNRMGATTGAATPLTPTTYDVLTLHNSANTLAWRRCLLIYEVGTSQISTQTQNPGDDCP